MCVVVGMAGVVAFFTAAGLHAAGMVSFFGAVGVFFGVGDGAILAAAGMFAARNRA